MQTQGQVQTVRVVRSQQFESGNLLATPALVLAGIARNVSLHRPHHAAAAPAALPL